MYWYELMHNIFPKDRCCEYIYIYTCTHASIFRIHTYEHIYVHMHQCLEYIYMYMCAKGHSINKGNLG